MTKVNEQERLQIAARMRQKMLMHYIHYQPYQGADLNGPETFAEKVKQVTNVFITEIRKIKMQALNAYAIPYPQINEVIGCLIYFWARKNIQTGTFIEMLKLQGASDIEIGNESITYTLQEEQFQRGFKQYED